MADRRLLLAILLLPAAALVCHPVAAKQPASQLGVVAEKPSDGWFVEHGGKFLVPYTQEIPGTKVSFEMIPVPGAVAEVGVVGEGEFEDAEFSTSPRMRVRLPPYWIAKREVSWAEYWKFMELDSRFFELRELRKLAAGEQRPKVSPLLQKHPELWREVSTGPEGVDAITAPTPLYDPSTTYESGEEPNLPAVSMTVYAAKQYSKWLSTITGVGYRLPSEAEWEHAARAGGGDGPYGAGEGGEAVTADNLDEFAWTMDNGDYATHEIGSLKPNAWGLSNMLGNAAEWVLDVPAENEPAVGLDKPRTWAQAVAWPKEAGPRIAKGGYYDADAGDCRIASRMLSDEEEWKYSDPNIPTSPWWYADFPATGVGFRLVRPLAPMDADLRAKVWEIDNPTTDANVAARLKEGRSKLGRVTPELPKVLEQLKEREVEKLLK